MIKGTGEIVSDENEDGEPISFLTTEQILGQLEKFGFIVKYDLKSNLPQQVISYLSQLYNLGYDKITRIGVRMKNKSVSTYVRSTVIVFKSCPETMDFLEFNRVFNVNVFQEKLDANLVINVTDEPGMVWDWINYMANISDLLDENIDDTDDFETKTDIESGNMTPYEGSDTGIPEGFSIYTGE